MPDDENIQLLLAKLPSDSLARRLVAPFAAYPPDEAVKVAQSVLSTLKDAHLKEKAGGSAEAA